MTTHRSLNEQIWRYLCQQETPCTTADIGHHFDLSTYRALYYLQMLSREEKVVRLMSGRGHASLWQGIKSTKAKKRKSAMPSGN